MERSKQLGEESVGKLLVKFSFPAIVGMLVNSLYNIVDRMFIGNYVGKDALSGLTVTFPIAIIIMAFGMLVGIGGGATISLRLGERKKEEAEKILGNVFVLLILVSVGITVIGISFLEPILVAFGASANTVGYAVSYISIILFGAVLQNVGFGLNACIRSEGNPKIAMLTMLIGGILNIVLDYYFMAKLGLGIQGAAYATVISQMVSSIWVLWYFTKGKSTLKLKVKNFKLEKKLILAIFAIGMSPFAMQIASSVVTVIQNKSLAYYGGDVSIAVMGAINSISTIMFMPLFGINQGSQPIIGYNYGAKNYDRVKRAYKLAAIAATIISIAGFILLQTFPKQLIELFNSDEQLLSLGAGAMRKFSLMFMVIGFQVVTSNFFQAIGRAAISMILSLLRQVIILIPLILILPRFLALDGVWFASSVADGLSAFITAFFMIREFKKINKLKEKQMKLKNNKDVDEILDDIALE